MLHQHTSNYIIESSEFLTQKGTLANALEWKRDIESQKTLRFTLGNFPQTFLQLFREEARRFQSAGNLKLRHRSSYRSESEEFKVTALGEMFFRHRRSMLSIESYS